MIVKNFYSLFNLILLFHVYQRTTATKKNVNIYYIHIHICKKKKKLINFQQYKLN